MGGFYFLCEPPMSGSGRPDQSASGRLLPVTEESNQPMVDVHASGRYALIDLMPKLEWDLVLAVAKFNA